LQEAVVSSQTPFRSGYPVESRFINGWYCPVCGCVTEHIEQDGYRKCVKCWLSLPYLISTKAPDAERVARQAERSRNYAKFFGSIRFYIKQSEIDALASALGRYHRAFNQPNYGKLRRYFFQSDKFEVD
jgi:hypothetical protein